MSCRMCKVCPFNITLIDVTLWLGAAVVIGAVGGGGGGPA